MQEDHSVDETCFANGDIYHYNPYKKHRQFIPAVRCEYNKNNKCALQSPSNATMEDFYKDLRRWKFRIMPRRLALWHCNRFLSLRVLIQIAHMHTYTLIRLSLSHQLQSSLLIIYRVQYIRDIYILRSNVQHFRSFAVCVAFRNVQSGAFKSSTLL